MSIDLAKNLFYMQNLYKIILTQKLYWVILFAFVAKRISLF